MRIANDSRYGLGGGIFSRNEDRAIELARLHFDTGMVNINGYNLAQPHLPFGGVKDMVVSMAASAFASSSISRR